MPPAETDRQDKGFPNAATPAGSLRYYAVRFAAPARRDAMARLLGWYDTIRAIAVEPRDPGVARLKLDWWRTELDRLQDGAARHPLTQALQAGPSRGPDIVDDLRQVLDGTETELRSPGPLDEAGFVAACRATGGAICGALATIDEASGAHAIAVQAGIYCEAVERTRQVHTWPDRFCWPDAGTDTAQPEWELHCDRLLGRLAEAARPMDGLEAGQTPLRLYALYERLHVTMRRSGFPRDGRLVDRPPIAHLWTAWRSR